LSPERRDRSVHGHGASLQVDESRIVEEAWNAVASRYKAYWSPRLRPYLERAVAAFHPAPPGPIAVPGCGPGEEVLLLLENFPDRSVIALDISIEMVALLKKDLRERGIGSVVATVGAAENLSAFVRQAAGVLSCFTLDLLPNPLAALTDWSRCLRAGGSIVILFWPRPRTGTPTARIQAAIQAKTGQGKLLWEARALEALPLFGLRLVRDERVQFEVPCETPQEYFQAMMDAGPLQMVARKFGADLLKECMKSWLVNHGLRRKGSTWTDLPEARLWLIERTDEELSH